MHDLARLPSPSPTAAAPSGPLPLDVAAITMPEPQRRGRMTRLRERVLEWNIHRWAGEMRCALPDPEVIS